MGRKGKKEVVFFARGKRKESIVRVRLKEGKGTIRFNSLSLDALENKYIKNIILEPLVVVGDNLASKLDISINARGGGQMGQAQAAAIAIAKALVSYQPGLKEKLLAENRTLFVEDVRRVEPKKYKGPKARARFQKSYR
ncbi:MAG: 30S ribosomal protein S9 [Candidatus Anstonellaceae archaeon]